MSDTSQGAGWWLATDGKWYSPEQKPAPMYSTTPSDVAAAMANSPGTVQEAKATVPDSTAEEGGGTGKRDPMSPWIGIGIMIVGLVGIFLIVGIVF